MPEELAPADEVEGSVRLDVSSETSDVDELFLELAVEEPLSNDVGEVPAEPERATTKSILVLVHRSQSLILPAAI